MTDGNKVAAAILAAEAARQEHDLLSSQGTKPNGREISASVLKLYEYFLRKMENKA